ncbi:hypothetical protein [uncultured Amphritea sp.]|uniref:hypothetical protein n=1 Tax=uncultured Amphritea sp. TaxID=981605 RepID=UPI002626A70E|nr:hypothetical protein [uncultured Amphritea sp.]
MSILDKLSQINTVQQHKPLNLAVKVTGYNIDHQNPDNNRLTGYRLDTKELVEVCVRHANSRNQPTIKDLQARVAIGGTVMLASTFPESLQPKIDHEASYLLSTRWATVMVPNQSAGKAMLMEARISVPFLKDDGGVVMSAEIIREATEVNSIEELEQTFFANLNPAENGVSGATPCAGIRIVDFGPNGEALDSEMVTFSPAFLQHKFGTDDINATFALYSTPGTPQYEKYQNTKQHIQQAIESPSTKVEVVKIARFGIGSKTKQSIANKLHTSNDMFNWATVPNLLSNDSNRTGFCKYFIALRPLEGGVGHVCTIAKPITNDGMATKSGYATLADKALFEQKHQTAQQNSAPEQAHQQPQQNRAPQQAYQEPQQSRAPQQSYQEPQQSRAPQQSYQEPQQNRAPQQAYQEPQQNRGNWNAEHSFQQPQQNAQGEFLVVAAGPGHFAIVPPNIDQNIEKSLLDTLNSHAHSRVQNGQWIFPESHRDPIVGNLDYAIKVISNGDQRYKGPEDQQQQSTGGSLDLDAISNEIDSLFPAQADTHGMNR